MSPTDDWPRDYVGYGRDRPDPSWPGGARLAVNISVNFEGGGEANVLDGDDASEGLLNDIGFPPVPGQRNPLVESVFEYGGRVGIWRILRILERFDVQVDVLGVATALQRSPEAAAAFGELGHDVVSHGYRWIDYAHVAPDVEREHIAKATELIEELTGRRPRGWMTGRPGTNTRRLLVEHGGYAFDRDALNDELPYWVDVQGTQHLVIPYSYESNDNRSNGSLAFAQSDDFFQYMRDAFDVMYDEGSEQPGLLSIGLHDRLTGRPARAAGLIRLLEHMRSRDDVWFARGVDIAEHWRSVHPAPS